MLVFKEVVSVHKTTNLYILSPSKQVNFILQNSSSLAS